MQVRYKFDHFNLLAGLYGAWNTTLAASLYYENNVGRNDCVETFVLQWEKQVGISGYIPGAWCDTPSFFFVTWH